MHRHLPGRIKVVHRRWRPSPEKYQFEKMIVAVNSPLSYGCIYVSSNNFQIFITSYLISKPLGLSAPHFTSAFTTYIDLWDVTHTVCCSCMTCTWVWWKRLLLVKASRSTGDVILTIHPHEVLKLRALGAIPPLLLMSLGHDAYSKGSKNWTFTGSTSSSRGISGTFTARRIVEVNVLTELTELCWQSLVLINKH
jgi:hypothetical protein